MEAALCREEDPELFFPIGTAGPALLQIEEARAVCRRCPVEGECLAYAMTQRVSDGVWAGETADDLAKIKKNTQRREQRARAAAQGEVQEEVLSDVETSR